MRLGGTEHKAQTDLPACAATLFRCLALGAALSLAGVAQTSAPVTATIDINTSVTTPIAPAFSGVSADLGLPVEYWDYRFNALAAAIGFGWVRFPGRHQQRYLQLANRRGRAGVVRAVPRQLRRRSGRRSRWWREEEARSLIDAANRANLLGAPLIICVNGFTDTAASAGQLAALRQGQPDPGGGVGVVQRALSLTPPSSPPRPPIWTR